MTLVLATCTSEAVIFGADSRVRTCTIDPVTQNRVLLPELGTERKLFMLERIAIAAYGDGPAFHVPTVITYALPTRSAIYDVIRFLHATFSSAPDMHALVGGYDNGLPLLFDVRMNGQSMPLFPAMNQSPEIHHRGLPEGPGTIPQPSNATVENVISQMRILLEASISDFIGPPFDFVVIPRPVP
jgi:hypothetical protein